MNGWFIAYLIILTLKAGIHLAKHGEPVELNYSFWKVLFTAGISIWLISMAIKTGF